MMTYFRKSLMGRAPVRLALLHLIGCQILHRGKGNRAVFPVVLVQLDAAEFHARLLSYAAHEAR